MGGEPLAVPMMMRPGGEVVVVVENLGGRGFPWRLGSGCGMSRPVRT